LAKRLCGPQSQSGHGEEEKNSQPPHEIKPPNPDHPAHSQSTIINSYNFLHPPFRSKYSQPRFHGKHGISCPASQLSVSRELFSMQFVLMTLKLVPKITKIKKEGD
jgi:hypothetical protein